MTGRLIAVMSGKGGVGKTMLTAALGAQWAARGKRVVLVDMNIGMRGLDMLMGLESRVGFDLGDVVEGACGLDSALLENRQLGVRIIAAKQFDEKKPLKERTLQIILEVLCLQNDIVLMDAPSGLSYGLELTARMAQEFLMVTTPDDASLRDAERTAAVLDTLEKPRPLLVVNRIHPRLVAEGLQYGPEVCAQLLDMRLAGVIPEDREAMRCTLRREVLHGAFPAMWALENLVERLDDMNAPLLPWYEEAGGMI